MLTAEGPKVLEYNVRFGDPETQVVLPRFAGDLAELLAEAAGGRLKTEPRWTEDAAVTVVLAAAGYPASPRTGDVIKGLPEADRRPGVLVFRAAVEVDERGRTLTAGGRVLNVTALGRDLAGARRRAYDAVGLISWPGMHYRQDIAERAAGQAVRA
jgi:phosphoribosylamine--glycine ligase